MKLFYSLVLGFIVLMLLVLAGSATFYVLQGQFYFWQPPEKGLMQSVEWANFGTFLGGVAGPSLTVVSGVFVALGLALQADSMSQAFKQSNMEASHASLGWARQKLDEVLQRPLRIDGATVQSVVVKHAQNLPVALTPEEQARLTAMAPELLYWLGAAVQQVELFRGNQEAHSFTLQHERRFYGEVIKFLKAHQKSLPGMLPMTLGMVDSHFQ